MFVDYLTKWPEVFATSEETALTIAKLFVEQIVCRNGVPAQLLSDRGAAFLSHLLTEICKLLGVEKLSTTAYHLQMNGLVECFNCTLTDMLAEKVEQSGKNWDNHLPFVLFAYRASLKESTNESPFYLLYGWDPRLPTTLGLDSLQQSEVDLDTYKGEIAIKFSAAWELAKENIKKAQQRQKKQYDCKTRLSEFKVADRVFVYMPAVKACKAYKFARSFHGPYRIVELSKTGIVVHPVDQLQADPIRVAYNRIHQYSGLIPDKFWPTRTRVIRTKSKRHDGTSADGAVMWNTTGSKSMSSKSEDKTVRQPHKENSKDPQPTKERLPGNQPRVSTEIESSNERAAESLTWKSRLRPRKTGVVT